MGETLLLIFSGPHNQEVKLETLFLLKGHKNLVFTSQPFLEQTDNNGGIIFSLSTSYSLC